MQVWSHRAIGARETQQGIIELATYGQVCSGGVMELAVKIFLLDSYRTTTGYG